MKTHLVSGGCGFVGRNMVKRLYAKTSDRIIFVDDLSVGTHPTTWLDAPMNREEGKISFYGEQDRLVFLHDDFRNVLRELTADGSWFQTAYGISVQSFADVFHFAAIVGGRAKIDGDPMQVALDLAIDAEFFYWATKQRPERILYPSSSAAYPVSKQTEENTIQLKESDIDFNNMGQPDMTYGWTKLTGEYLAKIAAEHYDLKVTCIRPFSGYGEDQDYSYPVPAIARRAVMKEAPFEVWGSGHQGRDFVHIDDVMDCMLLAMDKLNDGTAINIGMGVLTSFRDLIRVFSSFAGYAPEIKPLLDKPVGVHSRYCNMDFVKETLGWEAKISLEEGMKRVYDAVMEKEKVLYATKRVVCFGPGPAFKGGLANYNTSLAKSLAQLEHVDVHLISWTQQYPSIVPREFKDTVSKVDPLEGTGVECTYLTNYNKPSTWKKTAELIRDWKADVVVFQWSMAIQGLPLSKIIKRVQKIASCEVIMDLHFVVQKEKSKIDKMLTKRALGVADTFIVHALQTYEELKVLFPNKRYELIYPGNKREVSKTSNAVLKLYHPIYDLFQPDPAFDVEAFKQEHNLKKNVFLFFGFIRKYKGLHHTIKAFKEVAEQRDDVSLLVCGESFWDTVDNSKLHIKIKRALFGLAKRILLSKSDNEQDYRPLDLIQEYGLEDRVAVFNRFIPNEEVHQFFQVSDCVTLFYDTATPSGIESLSYNFRLPILASTAGHFPETVKPGYNGYLAEKGNTGEMAKQMLHFLDHPIDRQNVDAVASTMSWDNYAKTILNIED